MSAVGEWWDSVSTIGRGSWSNVWDVATGDADAESKRIDDALAADNRRRLERGMITARQAEQREVELAAIGGSHYRADTAEEFVTGLELGAAATAEAVNNASGAVVGGVSGWLWKALDWRVLLIAALAGLWYVGAIPAGLALVRRWFASKAS